MKLIYFSLLVLYFNPLCIYANKELKQINVFECKYQSISFPQNNKGLNARISFWRNRYYIAWNIYLKGELLKEPKDNNGSVLMTLEIGEKNYSIVYNYNDKSIVKAYGQIPAEFTGQNHIWTGQGYRFSGKFPVLSSDYGKQWLLNVGVFDSRNKTLTIAENQQGVILVFPKQDVATVFKNNIASWQKEASQGNPFKRTIYKGLQEFKEPLKFDSKMCDTLNAWSYFGVAARAFTTAYAVTESDSPLKGNSNLLAYSIDSIDFLIGELNDEGVWWKPKRRKWKGGDPNTNRFILYVFCDAINCLQKTPEGKAAWERWKDPLSKAIDLQRKVYQFGLEFNQSGKKLDKNVLAQKIGVPKWMQQSDNTWGGEYLNQDAMILLSEYFAGVLYADPERLEFAKKINMQIQRQILPNGGFKYIYENVESPSYHFMNILLIGRYAHLSKNQDAVETIAKTANYWPSVMTQEGIPECWSDVWWKQNWDKANIPSLTISAACGKNSELDEILYNCLERNAPKVSWGAHSYLYAAPYWHGIKKGTKLADCYLKYDGGILGYRGRDNSFYYGLATGTELRNNFAGALISQENNVDPFGGALVSANIRIIENEKNLLGLFLANMAMKNTVSASNLNNDQAVLGVCYTPQRRGTVHIRRDNHPWKVTQVWHASKKGIVGLLTAEAVETSRVEEIRGELLLNVSVLNHISGQRWQADELAVKLLKPLGKVEKGISTQKTTGVRRRCQAIFLKQKLGRDVKKGELFSFAVWIGLRANKAPVLRAANSNEYNIQFPGGSTQNIVFNPEKKSITTE